MYKFLILACAVAAANAGYLGAPLAYSSPALVSQQSNILRTPGNLGQISTYSKTISTPYSSVSKSDVRVSNDALAYPQVAHAYAAPAYAAPAYAAPVAKFAYAAPVAKVAYAAPVAKVAYAAPVAKVAYAAPVATVAHAPVAVAHAPVAVAHGHALTYSAAPVVSHISFDGLGAHYAY